MNPSLQSKNYQTKSIHPSIESNLKRTIDIIGALIGLIFTGLVIVFSAIAMKLLDPGPIFYSQIRCGLYGKPFRIWKIRSMIVDADKLQHLIPNQADRQIFKNECDPRITRLGKFLRSTSLDEFPQFWNVLQGDMSLVGTRPPTIDEVQHYKNHHWQRLKVRPGITGEWQVCGRSQIKDFEKILELDLRYQHKWSIVYDLKLILKTVLIVFRRTGAV